MRWLALLLALCIPGVSAKSLNADDRQQVLEAVIDHLQVDYVEPDIGMQAAASMRRAWQSGDFDETSGDSFAELVSRRLQEYTGDGHLNIEYSETLIEPNKEGGDAFNAQEMERWYGAHLNFGVQKVERLEPNTGLLDLRVFAPPEMGGETVVAALTVLAHTDALIIDLRKNGGGMGAMAKLVASYLFDDAPRPLSGIYNRPSETLTQNHTYAYVAGPRFGPDKPVYVLLSSKTFSAAEALAYDLQALGRALVVGEVSAGGANPFAYRRIHPHFVLWSVTEKSVNPITGGNWQGSGVQPDIAVPAADALQAALEHLAENG